MNLAEIIAQYLRQPAPEEEREALAAMAAIDDVLTVLSEDEIEWSCDEAMLRL